MDYKENPETHIDLVNRLTDRFNNVGTCMGTGQREMYEQIAPYCLGKIVFDIGCGIGIGSNILSHFARFVWGLDLEDRHINFARQMYGHENMRFDQYDLLHSTPRELATAHIITCIEVIEHIDDYSAALKEIKRFMDNNTTLFISSPNRNSPTLQKDTPRNPLHVREWTAAEFYDVLIKNFKSVTLYSPNLQSTVDLDTQETPLIARCVGKL
jgi:2-polyprenyl-3-methyl-5-hydroxy-6-metoxy-1,4-benzoquinol methylase